MFPLLDASRVVAAKSFAGEKGPDGRFTSETGALPLRELGKTGALRDLDRAILDPRRLPIVIHDQRSMLAQRIIAIALGCEDLNDDLTLRTDPALQLAAGKVPDEGVLLGPPPTLCRLENHVDGKSLVRIAGVLVAQLIAVYPEPPESLILDFDATDDPIHGQQGGPLCHTLMAPYATGGGPRCHTLLAPFAPLSGTLPGIPRKLHFPEAKLPLRGGGIPRTLRPLGEA